MAAKKAKRVALGMGLDALLPDRLEGEFFLCPIEEIYPSPHQPRKHFIDETIEELAQSIREKGLIQPVILKRGESDGYELIAGERRWRAAQKAGLSEVPAVLREAEEKEVLELALIENLQREDLNPVEEARAYRRLMDEAGLTQNEMASKIGKSRAAVANSLRLLGLPKAALEALENGVITAGHARAILAAQGERQSQVFEAVVNKGLSVRQAEELASKAEPEKAAGKPMPGDPNIKALEERISRTLSARVSVKHGKAKGRGRITIEYASLDDMDRILEIIEGRK